MMKKTLMTSALATALSTGFALAADPAPVQEKTITQKQEQIYGSQMMTREEHARSGASPAFGVSTNYQYS